MEELALDPGGLRQRRNESLLARWWLKRRWMQSMSSQ